MADENINENININQEHSEDLESQILNIITKRKKAKTSCDAESIIHELPTKERGEVILALENLQNKFVITNKIYAGRETYSVVVPPNDNLVETHEESDESFIDRKLLEIKLESIKSDIIAELKPLIHSITQNIHNNPSHEHDYKDHVIDLYEERIKFLEEEMRVKNTLIQSLVENAINRNDTKNPSQETFNLQDKNVHLLKTVDNNDDFKFPKRTIPSRYINHGGMKEFIDVNRYHVLSDNDNEINEYEKNENDDGFIIQQPSTPQRKKVKKRKKVVQIMGDSIIKEIKGNRLSTDETNVYVKSFSGATTECMYDYVKPSLKYKPDVVILHTGTNDLRREDEPVTIVNNIIELVKNIHSDTTNVIISGITARNDKLQDKVNRVNSLLETECNKRNIGFIKNENIDPGNDLNRSKLHLSRRGTSKLAINFKNFIRKL